MDKLTGMLRLTKYRPNNFVLQEHAAACSCKAIDSQLMNQSGPGYIKIDQSPNTGFTQHNIAHFYAAGRILNIFYNIYFFNFKIV